MSLYDPESGIQIDAGLDGHDEHIDELTTLFEELQPYSAEIMTAGTGDVFSFAFHENTFYFGVIMLNEKKPEEKGKEPNRGSSSEAYPGDLYSHSSKAYSGNTFSCSSPSSWETAAEASYGDGSGSAIRQSDVDIVNDFVRDWKSRTPSPPPIEFADDSLSKRPRRRRKRSKFAPIEITHTSSSHTQGTLPEILDDTPLPSRPSSDIPNIDTPISATVDSSQTHNMDVFGMPKDHDNGLKHAQEEEGSRNDPYHNIHPTIPDQETPLYGTFGANQYPPSLFHDIPSSLFHDAINDQRPPSNPLKKCIGLIYLTTSSAPTPHLPSSLPGEVNIGIVLSPLHRSHGYARTAISLLLSWGFTEMHLHRIQASLVIDKSTGAPYRDRAMSLFTQSCFSHEGTRRRALFNPIANQWNDVQYLSILDTEYSMREYFTPAPRSLWDEMLARHQREREDLLRWEESKGLGGRSASRETIRMPVSPTSTTMSMRDGDSDSAMGGPDTRTPSPTESFSSIRSSLPPTSPAGSFSSSWSLVSGEHISSASSSSDAFSDYGSIRESDTEDW